MTASSRGRRSGLKIRRASALRGSIPPPGTKILLLSLRSKGFSSIVPPNANVEGVADAIVKVVDAPFGKRPFRVHYDPTQDEAEVVIMVCDRVRAELLRRIGLDDEMTPNDFTGQSKSASWSILWL